MHGGRYRRKRRRLGQCEEHNDGRREHCGIRLTNDAGRQRTRILTGCDQHRCRLGRTLCQRRQHDAHRNRNSRCEHFSRQLALFGFRVTTRLDERTFGRVGSRGFAARRFVGSLHSKYGRHVSLRLFLSLQRRHARSDRCSLRSSCSWRCRSLRSAITSRASNVIRLFRNSTLSVEHSWRAVCSCRCPSTVRPGLRCAINCNIRSIRSTAGASRPAASCSRIGMSVRSPRSCTTISARKAVRPGSTLDFSRTTTRTRRRSIPADSSSCRCGSHRASGSTISSNTATYGAHVGLNDLTLASPRWGGMYERTVGSTVVDAVMDFGEFEGRTVRRRAGSNRCDHVCAIARDLALGTCADR